MWGLLADIQFTLFYFPMSYLKTSVFKIYRNNAVPCFLCGCDGLSISATEKYWTYNREKEIISNEGLHNLSSSLHITWVITSRRMTWWACNTYGRVGNCLQYRKTWREEEHLGHLCVGGRLTSRQVIWVSCVRVCWISLAQDKGQLHAVVTTVMNVWLPWKVGNFLTSWGTVKFLRMISVPWN